MYTWINRIYNTITNSLYDNQYINTVRIDIVDDIKQNLSIVLYAYLRTLYMPAHSDIQPYKAFGLKHSKLS